MEQNTLTPATMKRGGRYNWKGQPDRLIYLGRNWSGNGYWHQFEKIGDPRPVWCEVVDAGLHMLEETHDKLEAHDREVRIKCLEDAADCLKPNSQASLYPEEYLRDMANELKEQS